MVLPSEKPSNHKSSGVFTFFTFSTILKGNLSNKSHRVFDCNTSFFQYVHKTENLLFSIIYGFDHF